jgi:hypothetical protein
VEKSKLVDSAGGPITSETRRKSERVEGLREFSSDYELMRVRVFKQRRQGEEEKENQRQGDGVWGRKKEGKRKRDFGNRFFRQTRERPKSIEY